jgi:hypothetical protein
MMPLTSAIKFTAESTFRYEFSAASHLGRYGINSHSSIKAWKQAGGSSALHVSFAQIPPTGEIPCWAFPHFNGSHDFYSYIPVPFCFKTFALLLEEYPQHTKHEQWQYDEEEYAQRLEHAKWQNEHFDSSDDTLTSFNALLDDIEIDL